MARREDNGTPTAWMDVAAPRYAPLGEDAIADVCVVGAGIAGMATAYSLAAEGKRVVVLDDGPVGGGMTQRTTAHLSNAIDDRYLRIERLHGREGARLAAESHTAAIDRIEAVVRDERIDCDFERLDGYLVAAPGTPPDFLGRELAAAQRAGLADVTAAARAPSGEFAAGECLRFPRQGQLHPGKYLAGIAHAHSALVVVDNTFATPVLQQPFSLGADIVVHSVTKYLAGHSDLIQGAALAKDAAVFEPIKFLQNAIGAVPAPLDCWLTLRGIKTLELRVQRRAQLHDCEWNEQHGEQREAHQSIAIREPAQAAFGKHAQLRDDHEQIQPRPVWRPWLVIDHDERHECDGRRHRAEQSPDGRRDDQHEEDVEQPPALDPRTARAVRAGRREQAISGWHVQRRLDGVERLAVAGHG